MKKTIVILGTLSALTLSGCSWFSNDSDSVLNPPEKIDGLVTASCEELVADLKTQNPSTPDDEIYRAAAVILYSDDQADAALACCQNISDEDAKSACIKR